VAHGELSVALISKSLATELLGTMVGGYNVHPLIELLDDAEVAGIAAEGLKKTLLMFDYFNDVAAKAKAGNAKAKAVMQSWADAEWFTSARKCPDHRHRLQGARRDQHRRPVARPDATTRPDIPMHYLAMLKNTRQDFGSRVGRPSSPRKTASAARCSSSRT
jgi:aconitate hydratase 2/2-methylisocitrate dehydratase